MNSNYDFNTGPTPRQEQGHERQADNGQLTTEIQSTNHDHPTKPILLHAFTEHEHRVLIPAITKSCGDSSAAVNGHTDDSLPNSDTTTDSFTFHCPDEVVLEQELTAQERQRSVRFRSRVRITSGLHSHRHRSQSQLLDASTFTHQIPPRPHSTEDDFAAFSADSSLSSSPSSSISAPLRSRDRDEETAQSRWGPLGQRVSVLAQRSRSRIGTGNRPDNEGPEKLWRRNYGGLNRSPSSTNGGAVEPNERTSLLRNAMMRSSYMGHDGAQGSQIDQDDLDDETEARLNQQIDLIFGKWPGRLLNHHWWWWRLEPVICCGLSTNDSDEQQ